jgi:ABC-type nitrate/sulfonate/bicarbonate transport system substrate-binding protein
MVTKVADSKGRVTLGRRFANKTVILREVDDTEVLVTLARVIPAREAWLFENPKALKAVVRGLKEAKARHFVKGPDLAADQKLADASEDE